MGAASRLQSRAPRALNEDGFETWFAFDNKCFAAADFFTILIKLIRQFRTIFATNMFIVVYVLILKYSFGFA